MVWFLLGSRKKIISHNENSNNLHEKSHDDTDSNDTNFSPSTSKKSRSKVTFNEAKITAQGKRKSMLK